MEDRTERQMEDKTERQMDIKRTIINGRIIQ